MMGKVRMGPAKRLWSYSSVFWPIFLIITILSILDRFFWNVWPRQSFATDTYKTGSDRIPIIDGPWTAVAYDVIARISGRYSMVALNALFFTMMHTTHYWLARSWVGRNWIDFTNDYERVIIHRKIAWYLCILMLLHVWSILFPAFFSGYGVEVKLGYFYLPLSEQKPSGFKDVNVLTKMVNMQGDDVYRLIMITLLLGPIVYYSQKWIASDYRVGIRLHQFVALMFFIDIIRRHTHPHSWVLNIPAFILWILDKWWGKYYLHGRVIVTTTPIGQEYMLFWFKRPPHEPVEDGIANVIQMRLPQAKLCCAHKTTCQAYLERKHPFTPITQRSRSLHPSITSQFSMQDSVLMVENNQLMKSGNLTPHDSKNLDMVELSLEDHVEEAKESQAARVRGTSVVSLDGKGEFWYDVVLLRVYEKPVSHTGQLKYGANMGTNPADVDEEEAQNEALIDVWGSFPKSRIHAHLFNGEPIILVGGGSGAAFLLDALSYLLHYSKSGLVRQSTVEIYFTTANVDLVHWFTTMVYRSLDEVPKESRIRVTISLTSGKSANHSIKQISDSYSYQTNDRKNYIGKQFDYF